MCQPDTSLFVDHERGISPLSFEPHLSTYTPTRRLPLVCVPNPTVQTPRLKHGEWASYPRTDDKLVAYLTITLVNVTAQSAWLQSTAYARR